MTVDHLEYIALYHPLAHAHIVDYFSLNLWDTFSSQEKMETDSIEGDVDSTLPPICELIEDIISGIQSSCPVEMHETVLAVLATSTFLPSLGKEENLHVSNFLQKLSKKTLHFLQSSRFLCQVVASSSSVEIPNDEVLSKIEDCLSIGCPKKKQVEVMQLAPLIHKVISKCVSKVEDITIVDVGAGQGYLSQTLSRSFSYHVVAVERALNNVHGSMKRAQKMRDRCENKKKKKGKKETKGNVAEITNADVDDMPLLSVVQCDVTNQTCPVDLEAVVSLQRIGEKIIHQRFALVSLHACGSLSEHMLRLFANWDSCVALVNVGCCYNVDVTSTVPLSQHWATIFSLVHDPKYPGGSENDSCVTSGLRWTRNMRLAACQAPQRWASCLEQSLESFQSNFGRAVLQEVLHKIGGVTSSTIQERIWMRSLPEPVQHSMKENVSDRFVERATAALQHNCPNLIHNGDTDEQIRAIWNQRQEKRLFLSTIWTVRAIVGQVFEFIILADRRDFLKEAGGDEIAVELVQVFKKEDSPRNVAVVATRVAHSRGPPSSSIGVYH